MAEEKVIHFNLYRPDRAFFKPSANERAQAQIITCNNSDNCSLHAQGTCICQYSLGLRCPYGGKSRIFGYTRRARKYLSWCSEQKERYKGIPYLKEPKMLGFVGELVFLPYSYMDMCEPIRWAGKHKLRKEDFITENIIKLVEFVPRTLYGYRVIESYQKEEIPKFLKHLSELAPKLFQEIIVQSEYALEKYKEFSNIGRKAILDTLVPNMGVLIDIHGGKWVWDGERLHSTYNKVAFALVDKFEKISITPVKGQLVEITAEEQVNKGTIFAE